MAFQFFQLRNRWSWFVVLLLVFTFGFASRLHPLNDFLYPAVGDICYAWCIYSGIRWLLPSLNNHIYFFSALAWCLFVEIIHFFPAYTTWIAFTLPNYKWLIGEGFQWSDIMAYSLALIAIHGWTISVEKSQRTRL